MSNYKRFFTAENRCNRCSSRQLHSISLGLCASCYSTFQRLKRAQNKNGSQTFTVSEFIRLCPPRPSRLSAAIAKKFARSEVVPGFLVCGDVTKNLALLVQRIAQSDIPVIIEGETGVGKEGVARALHVLSARNRGKFVPVNCATISHDIASSEIFGHRKGSFTGADGHTVGFYGEADGGVIFFDEIEVFPLTLQGSLLRVLDSGEVRPVGSSRLCSVNVRTIVATNKNIEQLCAEGLFRTDLYQRLNGITVRVPPLRERKEEIPVLIQYFLSRCSAPGLTLDDSVRDIFFQYSWPGNIRQLKMVIERASIFAREGTITLEHIPEEIRGVQHGPLLRAVR